MEDPVGRTQKAITRREIDLLDDSVIYLHEVIRNSEAYAGHVAERRHLLLQTIDRGREIIQGIKDAHVIDFFLLCFRPQTVPQKVQCPRRTF